MSNILDFLLVLVSKTPFMELPCFILCQKPSGNLSFLAQYALSFFQTLSFLAEFFFQVVKKKAWNT